MEEEQESTEEQQSTSAPVDTESNLAPPSESDDREGWNGPGDFPTESEPAQSEYAEPEPDKTAEECPEGQERSSSRPSTRAKSTPYPGKTSDGSYNIKPKSRNGPATMSAYYKEQDAKRRLRALRSDDPTNGMRKHNYDKHRERVKTARPQVDSSCPFACKNIYVSQTKFNRSLASFTKIERDNARMLHRIAVIMQGPATVDNRLKQNTKTMFPKGKARQVDLMHITFDNLHLLQRIEEQKPTYDRKKQMSDYQRAEKDMEKMSYYPLFWKCKKPSVLDDFRDSAMQNAQSCPRPRVYMDFETDRVEGRIVIELRADIVPMSAENFRCLCTGENGPSYKCTQITRVVKDILIQGGDISGKAFGMFSGFGDSFPEENFKLKHSDPGVVTMVNYGAGTTGSQFMITGKRLRSLDGSNVAVGKVIEGMDIVCKFFENVTSSDKPSKQIWITGCGQLPGGSGDDEQEEEPETESEAPKKAVAPKMKQNRRPMPVKKSKPPTSVRPATTTTDTDRESSAIPESDTDYSKPTDSEFYEAGETVEAAEE